MACKSHVYFMDESWLEKIDTDDKTTIIKKMQAKGFTCDGRLIPISIKPYFLPRTIIDKDLIDDHYKKVARAILEKVPVIHLGQRNLGLEYNADIIEPTRNIMAKRKALNTTLFQWR